MNRPLSWHRWVARLLVGTVVGLTACSERGLPSDSSGDKPLEGRLTVTGSSTIAPLVAEIAKHFERLHPAVRVDVQTGGSSRGITDILRGTADIGMASRPLSDREHEQLTPHVIARDGICVIVHADNTVGRLTDRQIRNVYTGKIKNWRQFGGPDAPIIVVQKAAGRATLDVFESHFKIDSKSVRASVIIGDNEQAIKTVAQNRYAIGYVSVGTAEYSAKHGVTIKPLPAGDVEATSENVATGRFEIGRPLNLVTRGPAQGLAKVFVNYCQSQAVHDIVRDLHFVPPARKG